MISVASFMPPFCCPAYCIGWKGGLSKLVGVMQTALSRPGGAVALYLTVVTLYSGCTDSSI